MRNPFKKYGHIRTRYDEMKKLDKAWRHEKIFSEIWEDIKKQQENIYICGCGR